MRLLFFSYLVVCCHSLYAAESVGTIEIFYGEATIFRGNEYFPAKKGSQIQVSDLIETKANSILKLTMKDKNIFHMAPLTKLQINIYQLSDSKNTGAVEMELLEGGVRNEVLQRYNAETTFEVKTPLTVSIARGTDFLVEHNEIQGQSSVTVFEGIVDVGNKNNENEIFFPTRLTSSQRTRILFGSNPEKPFLVVKRFLDKVKNDFTTDTRIKHYLLMQKVKEHQDKRADNKTEDEKKPKKKIKSRKELIEEAYKQEQAQIKKKRYKQFDHWLEKKTKVKRDPIETVLEKKADPVETPDEDPTAE